MFRKGSAIGAIVLTAGLSTVGLGAFASQAGADTVNYNTYNITYNITINNYGTLTIYFTAGGFTPGEKVSETLHSAPVHVGDVKAGPKGTVSTSVAVPKSLPVGEHELLLTGLKSGHVDAMSFYDSGSRASTGGYTGAPTSGTSGGVSSAVGGTASVSKPAGSIRHAGAASSAVASPVVSGVSSGAAAAQIQGSGATTAGTHRSIKFDGSSSTEVAAGLAALFAVGGLGVAATRKRKRQSWAAS